MRVTPAYQRVFGTHSKGPPEFEIGSKTRGQEKGARQGTKTKTRGQDKGLRQRQGTKTRDRDNGSRHRQGTKTKTKTKTRDQDKDKGPRQRQGTKTKTRDQDKDKGPRQRQGTKTKTSDQDKGPRQRQVTKTRDQDKDKGPRQRQGTKTKTRDQDKDKGPRQRQGTKTKTSDQDKGPRQRQGTKTKTRDQNKDKGPRQRQGTKTKTRDQDKEPRQGALIFHDNYARYNPKTTNINLGYTIHNFKAREADEPKAKALPLFHTFLFLSFKKDIITDFLNSSILLISSKTRSPLQFSKFMTGDCNDQKQAGETDESRRKACLPKMFEIDEKQSECLLIFGINHHFAILHERNREKS
ncbi:U1 small nuclear ribonucleoprotein 70 kDa-like [Penaeus japonicus]|uniref:U1 small nuclear ribonucleoprotein 70 kDa-like n=1 Tax=Penaeus japonicus TaxID=27405 RepID=UPI001C70C345|nr:U1 small nuclear ribonucleoprotein 70 kDa-like [Penaeus japonicus]